LLDLSPVHSLEGDLTLHKLLFEKKLESTKAILAGSTKGKYEFFLLNGGISIFEVESVC
jgi:hypothetical protein